MREQSITNQQRIPLPSRSRRYRVGKEIGGATYVHRDYEHLLGAPVQEAKERLPGDFDYTVVKYRPRAETVSFIESPDFDSSSEPIVGDIWIISRDGRAKLRRRPNDPEIYHHKWLFVADDYVGFDIDESKAHSRAWTSLPNVDRSRIGRRSYWSAVVVPQLESK